MFTNEDDNMARKNLKQLSVVASLMIDHDAIKELDAVHE
jgi:hypothetical protein